MSDHTRRRLRLGSIAAVGTLSISLLSVAGGAVSNAASTAPSGGRISVGKASVVDLRTAPRYPAKHGAVRFRPAGISDAAYAAAQARRVTPRASTARPGAPAVPPTLKTVNFGGTNQSQGGCFPPDGDVAVNNGRVMQAVNCALAIYTKTGGLLSRVSFNTFYGQPSDFIFDARTFFDPSAKRWIVLADGDVNSSGNQNLYLAISRTGDPLGSYFQYVIPIQTNNDFFDFPQLGVDNNSVIISGNVFPSAGGVFSRNFTVPKSAIYNGAGFSVNTVNLGACTVAPPRVIAGTTTTTAFLLQACGGTNISTVRVWKATNTGASGGGTYSFHADITVPTYSSPPAAAQPTVNYPLETGDARFEQRSYQIGNDLWNVHSERIGTATPRWYRFNTASKTVTNNGIWFATGTSSDWHGSIAVNGIGEAFGTWMSTDTGGAGTFINVRHNGGQGGTAGSGSGTALFTSSRALTGQTFNGRNRSGDYSAVALDPAAYGSCGKGRRAYIEGETAAAAVNNWGTRIGRIGFC